MGWGRWGPHYAWRQSSFPAGLTNLICWLRPARRTFSPFSFICFFPPLLSLFLSLLLFFFVFFPPGAPVFRVMASGLVSAQRPERRNPLGLESECRRYGDGPMTAGRRTVVTLFSEAGEVGEGQAAPRGDGTPVYATSPRPCCRSPSTA